MAVTTTCAVTRTRRPSFAPQPSHSCRQLLRWQTRLSHNNCTPLLAVAKPLSPPVREPRYVPSLFVSTDAAKAHQHGQVLGLCGYCHGLFFSLPLSQRTRHANSIATLELMVLAAAVATFHAFFRYFPRAVLESDSLSATFHLAENKAKDNAAQRALEHLHAMPAFLSSKPQLHVRHVFDTANPMADACSRGDLQKLHALCARLGVNPERLEVLPHVAAFLGSLIPEHGVFNFDLLTLAGDVEVHPGLSGTLAAIADALREAHSLAPSPTPPAAPSSASFRAVASDLYHLAPEQTELTLSVPAHAVRNVAPLPLPSALAYGLQPTLAPPSSMHDHLPHFAECHVPAATVHMHEQFDGCLAALHSLKDNPGTVKKDKEACRRYWMPLTELLGVAKWRENPVTRDAILRAARLLCKVLLLVLSTMRPRRKQNAAPRPASGECFQAGSKGAPAGSRQRIDQSGALAPRNGRPSAAVCCPAQSRGLPSPEQVLHASQRISPLHRLLCLA
eukprot:6214798-Pleurochrysis_carterae.AAC.5